MWSLIKLVASFAFSAYKNLLWLERVMRAPHRALLHWLLKDQTQFAKRLGKLSPKERKMFSERMTEHLRTTSSQEANEHLREIHEAFIKERNGEQNTSKENQEVMEEVLTVCNRGIKTPTTPKIAGGCINTLPGKNIPPNRVPPHRPGKTPRTPIGGDTVLPKKDKKSDKPIDYSDTVRKKQEPDGRPINEYGDFSLLSSSWISAGVFFQQTFEQGFLEISVLKTGKHYVYPNVSLSTWEAMKAARGKNGSGAGSVFWVLYLRPLHFGSVKGKYLSQYRQIKKDLGIKAKDTLKNIIEGWASNIVNMYKRP